MSSGYRHKTWLHCQIIASCSFNVEGIMNQKQREIKNWVGYCVVKYAVSNCMRLGSLERIACLTLSDYRNKWKLARLTGTVRVFRLQNCTLRFAFPFFRSTGLKPYCSYTGWSICSRAHAREENSGRTSHFYHMFEKLLILRFAYHAKWSKQSHQHSVMSFSD